jgi:hypothetical protein
MNDIGTDISAESADRAEFEEKTKNKLDKQLKGIRAMAK